MQTFLFQSQCQDHNEKDISFCLNPVFLRGIVPHNLTFYIIMNMHSTSNTIIKKMIKNCIPDVIILSNRVPNSISCE